MSGIGAPKPPKMNLAVESGGDYVETIRWSGGDYPAGSELELVIGALPGTVYPYAISGDSATIKIESEVCDLWSGEYRLRYRDTTTTPTTETIVCTGRIVRT